MRQLFQTLHAIGGRGLHMAALAVFLCSLLGAQTIPNAVPMPTPEIQYLDQNGLPLAGSKVCTYSAGTSTPLATYTDSTAGVQNTNPIVLDAAGRASVWVGPNAYKFVLLTGGDGTCSTGTVVWTQDQVVDTTLNFVNFVKNAGTCTVITYTDPVTGSVQRTCSSRLADRVDVKDFGALCDGSTDDTTALQLAINSAAAAGVTLYGSSAVCLATALTLPSNLILTGQGPGQFTLRAKANTAVAGTPFLKNSNAGGGNSNIRLSNLTIDGNAFNQGLSRAGALNQEIPSLSLINVTDVAIDNVNFVNSAAAAVYGYAWTRFAVTNSKATTYGNYSSTWPNTAAVQLDYNNATGASADLRFTDNFFDGSGEHVGGIKLAGTSTFTLTGINVQRNTVIVGNANNPGNTLGIELFSNAGLGFFDCNVSGNIIRGESASSPLSLSTGATWGISLAGSGGQGCTVANNNIKWVGAYSIETGGSGHLAITGNHINTAGQISTLGAPGAVTITDISITGNVIYNPVEANSASTTAPAIYLYSQVSSTIRGVTISGNTITYVATPAAGGMGIWVQCNSGAGSITDVVIADNAIYGPGSGTTIDGIVLEQDSTCPVDRTQVRGNTFDNLRYGVKFGADTNTQLSGNIYKTVSAVSNGTPDVTDVLADVVVPANFNTAWTTLQPTYNVLLTKPGQYFQVNSGATTPNIITWNAQNGGDCSVGGIFSTNSRQNKATDPAPNGWTQTSTGAFARAGYYALGACKFTVAFGPATGAGPNPPTDTNVLVCEDTNANSGGVNVGGCGIGQAGIASNSRIQNLWTASAAWNPGTIASGGTAVTSLTVTGCAAGDLASGQLTTATTQTLLVTALSSTNQVNVIIYNPTGGGITPGAGTAKVWCVHTNQ